MEYTSFTTWESRAFPGVRFRVRRLSLARRMDLVREIRNAGNALSFHEAGEGITDAAMAAEIRSRIDALYIRWGLESIEGICIDGEPADAERVIERGPDALAREIAQAVRSELFLSEEERKN
jgi:hypothetical protein